MTNTSLLKDLLQIPSYSGQEDMIHKYIEGYIKMREIEVYRSETFVVGYAAGKNSRRALVFNAHTDTVPAENLDQWSHGPFSGDIVDGKIFGRGASDMKIAVASQLEVMEKCVAVDGVDCDVYFTFVAREETDGEGTKNFLKWFEAKRIKYEEIAVIVGEPTGLKSFVVGHKGNIFVKASVEGDTGHGSKPEMIKSHSIFEMQRVIDRVLAIAEQWNERYPHAVLGKPSVGVTSISGGNGLAPNIFPSRCEATFDIRTTPALHDKVMEELQKEIPTAQFEILYQPSPCAYTEASELICKTVGHVSGLEGRTVGWASDLCYFTAAGIPGVILGPGEESQLHAVDEYGVLEKLDRCVKLYGQIITEFSSKNL